MIKRLFIFSAIFYSNYCTLSWSNDYDKMATICIKEANKALTLALGEPISLNKVTIEVQNSQDPISGGSAGFGVIKLQGIPNQFVMCHEVFHLLWEYLAIHYKSPMPMFPKNNSGKTTELYESLPQIFSILVNDDCMYTQSRNNIDAFKFDHCEFKQRKDLPKAKERYLMAKTHYDSLGKPNSYIDYIVNVASTERPSAYDASRPLGAVLFKGLKTCGKEFILSQLVQFLYESARNESLSSYVFQDTDTFGRSFIEYLTSRFNNNRCLEILNSGLIELTSN